MASLLATKEEKEFYYKEARLRFGERKIGRPEYMNHPEGEDLFGKLRFTTKWAAMAGGLFGMMKAYVQAEKLTTKEWTFLFFKPVVPAVGMAAIFTVTTYLATNFRKKDDLFNYGLGGAAAGLVFGAALRSKPHGVVGVCCFSAAAMCYKNFNMPLFVPVHRIQWTPYEAERLDMSFTPPKKGNWSKEKVEDA